MHKSAVPGVNGTTLTPQSILLFVKTGTFVQEAEWNLNKVSTKYWS